MERPKRRTRQGAAAGRSYTCDYEGCGRSFTRSEHLHRHQKNHGEGAHTCPRCRAHFKRQDLLERHLARHRERDLEAGGEGTGTLNTRKKLWKDHDGRIVQRKPVVHTSGGDGIHQESFEALGEEPISPPTSSQGSDQANENGVPSSSYIEDNNALQSYPSAGLSCEPQEFWGSAPASQPEGFMQTQLDMNFDDIFQSDTASSFNMPFTTQNNYNWIFNVNENYHTPDQRLSMVSQPLLGPYPPYSFNQSNPTDMHQVPPRTVIAGFPEQRPEQDSFTSPPLSIAGLSQSSNRHGSSDGNRSLASPTSRLQSQQPSAKSQGDVPVPLECPLGRLKAPKAHPLIDNFTHSRIMQVIEEARPLGPDRSILNINHALLSQDSIQNYLDLYFYNFNAAYPLIHQPTFNPSQIESLFLLSIILLGATYSSKDAHQLAVCIHDVIRPQIFAHASFSPKPALWMLQTILLVECFGKSRAGQRQHDMSHLFHGMLINLIRRSDCQSVRPVRPSHADNEQTDPEGAWRQWAQAEEKKRLALLCFMWDTQHAVLFCQSLCMSAFELRVALPCDQTLWEAPTASEWSQLSYSTPPEPSFLHSLKAYLNDNDDATRQGTTMASAMSMNGLSRVILFHGLMSIFWDMQRRDQTSLGVIASPTGHSGRWQGRLELAYAAWKRDFDAFCRALARATDAEIRAGALAPDAGTALDAWCAAYAAVYHAAVVLLHADFLDVQIYAGARHILGNRVQPQDFRRSEKVVKRWASSSAVRDGGSVRGMDAAPPRGQEQGQGQGQYANAATAAWHAACLLQLAARKLVDYDAMGLFHVPWTLYLATLTIWAFDHAGAKGPGTGSGGEDDCELIWDARGEMHALVQVLVDAGVEGIASMQYPRRTSGMVWIMAGVLKKVRWGIVHQGVEVLERLIPWRLIGQLEAAELTG
ncbi:fungal-specific transcription factor domain-containing protein [Xylariaceae sp. FL0016]|nr:fungal-specific transcription factor domain-containing protein [Xylariaceae sp. FL0016]